MSHTPAHKTWTFQTASPLTGTTVTFDAPNSFLILTPAGTLATLTVNLPPSPADNDQAALRCSQIVTALTMGGGTIIGALTALVAGNFASFIYRAADTTWYRYA